MFGDLGFNFCLMPFIRPVNIKDDERTFGFGVGTPIIWFLVVSITTVIIIPPLYHFVKCFDEISAILTHCTYIFLYSRGFLTVRTSI